MFLPKTNAYVDFLTFNALSASTVMMISILQNILLKLSITIFSDVSDPIESIVSFSWNVLLGKSKMLYFLISKSHVTFSAGISPWLSIVKSMFFRFVVMFPIFSIEIEMVFVFVLLYPSLSSTDRDML